ncbi:MAG: hypothetical protein K9L28_06120 [Synergistales bacterium]|nr:hypothetical protein [Synergistales bacterium]
MEKNRNVGLWCALASTAIFAFLIFGFIMKMPVKVDTLILFSWPILPGIIGSLIFFFRDRAGHWDQEQAGNE